jgi:hypothetical protein
MSADNGNYVSRAELAAHIKGIDEHFDTISADIQEIKWSMNLVLENKRQRWRAWGPPILAAVIAGVVSLAVALIFY